MQLSKNFTLTEMLQSQTAHRFNITEQFNPPESVVISLQALCINILQPLREKAGPLKINSGYRCHKVNGLVGGSESSQHLKGLAADIEGIRISNKRLFQIIKELQLPYDQLIWEYGTKDEPAWVHVSFSSRNRRQILWIPAKLKP